MINSGAFYFEATPAGDGYRAGRLVTGTVGCNLEPWDKIKVKIQDLITVDTDGTVYVYEDMLTTVWNEERCSKCPFGPAAETYQIKCRVAKKI